MPATGETGMCLCVKFGANSWSQSGGIAPLTCGVSCWSEGRGLSISD